MKKTIRQLMSFVETKEHYIVLTLSFLLIFGGIIYSFYLGGNLRFSDEHEYYNIAKNLAFKQMYSVDGVNPTASRPPVYPFLLSLIISFGGTITHLRFINFIALGSSIYLLYLIVQKQSSQFAGLVSAVLVACYPVLFYAASILLTEVVGIFLFLLILLLLINAKTVSVKPFLLIGLLFGCLILTVPYFIFSFLVFVLWLTLSKRDEGVKASAAVFLVAITIISMWTARNYATFNSFVFISTHGARAFYQGNFKGATANPVSKTDYLIPQEVYDKLNEVELAKYYKSKAIEHILEDKTRTIKLYFLKVLNYFNYHTILSSDTESYVSKYKDVIMLLTYGPLLLLFLLRMLSFKKYRASKFELLLITLYLSNAFFLAIFQTRMRYRLSFDFLLIAVVGMFIYNVSRSREY